MDKELEIAKVEADKEVVLAKEKTMTEREIAEGKALEKATMLTRLLILHLNSEIICLKRPNQSLLYLWFLWIS